MNRSQPTLAGSLMVFNLLSVLGLMVLARQPWAAAYQKILAGWLRVLSFPVGDLGGFLLDKDRRNSPMAIYGLFLSLGVNAFLWGQVLAWILRRTILARLIPSPPPPEDSPESEPPPSDRFSPF